MTTLERNVTNILEFVEQRVLELAAIGNIEGALFWEHDVLNRLVKLAAEKKLVEVETQWAAIIAYLDWRV